MVTIIIVIHKTDPNKLKYILDKIKDHHKIIFVVNSENYDFRYIFKKKLSNYNSENKGNGAAINLAFFSSKYRLCNILRYRCDN